MGFPRNLRMYWRKLMNWQGDSKTVILHQPSWRRGNFLTVAIVLLMALVLPSSSFAQKKYSPEDSEVVQVVDRAIKAIETMSPDPGGYQVLAALTIVESSKRYESRVPNEHPMVKSAVDKILADLGNGDMSRSDSVYYPALSLILLCDCGSSRYEEQINQLVRMLVDRQNSFGAFTYLKFANRSYGDTSQTQYVSLALWVAHQRGFALPFEVPGRALEFYMNVQLPGGAWPYEYDFDRGRARQSTQTLSIHAASLGTVYLLADFLQLNPKSKRTAAEKKKIAEDVKYGTALPPSVSIYVPPAKDGFQRQQKKTGPLFRIDRGRLSAIKGNGNRYFGDNFTPNLGSWGHYYLYAMERYAFFREKAEGSFREVPDWYDQGVEHLISSQNSNGTFEGGRHEIDLAATCFAVLFLVRSSEVLVPPSGEGGLNGGRGLPSNVRIDLHNGAVKAFSVINGLDDVLALLGDEDLDQQQYDLIKDSMAKSIGKLAGDKGQNRREYLNFMRGLVSDRNFFKRKLAIELLARQQDMDNVPALIYALGDPDLKICKAAHDGLRLISRKLDSIKIEGEPSFGEFQRLKKEWTNWFLKIRPGATLLD